MIRYVVGFAFSRDKKDVILIHKQKPEWQKDKFNGVGGKVENHELAIEAMVREFEEETGAHTEQEMWHQYATLKINDGTIELYCFRMFSNVIYQCVTKETEEIYRIAVDTAMGEYRFKVIPNLKVLVPMALDEDFIMADINAIVR